MARKKKRVLRTFLRSAIQATDSTLIGCTAKSAATSRLGPRRFVIQARRRNSRRASTVWRRALWRWWPAGFKPKSWQSRAWEIQVRGCQLAAVVAENAHWRVLQVRPSRTWEFAVT